MQYQIKTPVFEGPMEALLNLIEERKLDISQISLAQITDDYLNYIRQLEGESFPPAGGESSRKEKHLAELVGFLSVAATLVLIKSRALLPNLPLTEEEESQISNLEERLKVYAAIRAAGQEIAACYGRQVIFGRPEGMIIPVFSPTEQLTPANLLAALNVVLDNLPKQEVLPMASVHKAVTLEDMLKKLVARVESALKFNFRDFVKGANEKDDKERKVYVIVGFLALLELVRRGLASALQPGRFGEIIVEKS